MTHAAPASGGTGGKAVRAAPATPTTATRSTEIFGPGTHKAVKWALPLVLGLLFGYWAAANRRSGGPLTGWNVLFGFVTAIVFMTLYIAVRTLAPRLKREPHALLWAALAGAAVGFLVGQTDSTWLRATGLGLIVAVAFFLVLFYRFYTHEDAEGHRTG
ncbi:hypothetical protein ABZ354_22850 [Streptomyces sp. NPDC005925]|uniref:hypothetical protein n=1 Tax=Streptomyces sp. NPDC005925 TaxID=3157172 RepID=UPI0033D5D3C9